MTCSMNVWLRMEQIRKIDDIVRCLYGTKIKTPLHKGVNG